MTEDATPAGLIELLRDAQHARCAYGTREGDGRTCDCKFDLTRYGVRRTSETTGCPELRTAIWMLEGEEK